MTTEGRLHALIGGAGSGKTAKLLERYRTAKSIFGDASCCLVLFSENLSCDDCDKKECDACNGIISIENGYVLLHFKNYLRRKYLDFLGV